MKAALKYPVFYLAPAEHTVYVFWREEDGTTRRCRRLGRTDASPEGDMLSAAVGRLARMFRYPPEEEPSIRRVPVRFLVVALVVGLVIWLPVRYT